MIIKAKENVLLYAINRVMYLLLMQNFKGIPTLARKNERKKHVPSLSP